MSKFLAPALASICLVAGNHAIAATCTTSAINCDPPAGNVVLDLNGGVVPHTYKLYTTTFVASLSSTNISFAFRNDPHFLLLDDVSVTLGSGPNLLTNGGFESGVVNNSAPVGWTYLNQFGAGASGVVSVDNPRSGTYDYRDGAIQAYDGITQAIATAIGSTYTISFWLMDQGSLSTFSRLSTNGNILGSNGNGIDLIVYAGAIPTRVPEPGTLALLGLACMAFSFRLKKSA